jgi:hypothetical protein
LQERTRKRPHKQRRSHAIDHREAEIMALVEAISTEIQLRRVTAHDAVIALSAALEAYIRKAMPHHDVPEFAAQVAIEIFSQRVRMCRAIASWESRHAHDRH